MADTQTTSDPLVLLSAAVASEVGEALTIYYQVLDLLVNYLAGDENRDSLRSLQNGALTLAISLSDLGRTLDDLDGEGVAWIGEEDPRMIRPLVRALADSMTLLLAVRSQEDCYQVNVLDRDEVESWCNSGELVNWIARFPLSQ